MNPYFYQGHQIEVRKYCDLLKRSSLLRTSFTHGLVPRSEAGICIGGIFQKAVYGRTRQSKLVGDRRAAVAFTSQFYSFGNLVFGVAWLTPEVNLLLACFNVGNASPLSFFIGVGLRLGQRSHEADEWSLTA